MHPTQAKCRDTTFAGLPAWELWLPNGDHALVARQGAQVLSWVAGGRERLYLSPRSALDGRTAIRGGIPVCFPQFNQRGPLPKHGFARNVAWAFGAADLKDAEAVLTLSLSDSEHTRQWWPQAFEANLQVQLLPGALHVELKVHNTDTQPLSFTGALHTYLALSDAAQASLTGLGGQAEWDSVQDAHRQADPELRFAGEFDRVYAAASNGLVLQDGQGSMVIEQDGGWASTVVWNPGASKCATLLDMPLDGWQRMLCVEAAQVFEPIELEPDAVWAGAQRLRVV